MNDTSKQQDKLSDDFYRRLCESAAVAMVATDERFNVVFWNAAAEAMLARRSGEMLARPLAQAVSSDRRRALDRLLSSVSQRRRTSQFRTRMTVRGQDRNLLVVLSPILDPDRTVRGVVAWIVDETPRRRLAQRLAESERMASLGTLAGGVAHHFNNILGGVATFVDYALDSGDPVAMKRALQMTAEAAARVAKITDSLLSFARPRYRSGDLADLTEVVLTFVHLCEKPLSERGIDLKLDLRPVPVVEVRAAAMRQALNNLLANAEDAMPRGGTIEIGIEREGDSVVLRFADTGEGIPREALPLIFDPFFTVRGLHAGGQQSREGLGLSVVRGLLLEMGAKIEADSSPGKGTRFRILFPAPQRDQDA